MIFIDFQWIFMLFRCFFRPNVLKNRAATGDLPVLKGLPPIMRAAGMRNICEGRVWPSSAKDTSTRPLSFTKKPT